MANGLIFQQMSPFGNCIVHLGKLEPIVFIIYISTINFCLPLFFYYRRLTYTDAIGKLLAIPIDIMDNHPDAT
jgi:hypothetical protein